MINDNTTLKPMLQPSHMRHLLHTALLLLALCGAGHIHNHVCLDGQEPADLVHFETLGGHPDHHADDAAHADIENELMPQALLTKVPNQDSPLFLFAVSMLMIYRQPLPQPQPPATDEQALPQSPSALLPPLRAPPYRSA